MRAIAPRLVTVTALVKVSGTGLVRNVLSRSVKVFPLVGLGPRLIVPVRPPPVSWIVASAAAFSYAHHAMGGEPYTHAAFLYRSLMGVILGAVFSLRGLGIVVYAHALYNVSLELLRHVP